MIAGSYFISPLFLSLLFSLLVLSLPISHAAKATICPNNCSNIGECYQGLCYCPEGFYGGDCSLRYCPVSENWADKAADDEQAHSYGECSNQGICNAKTGKCQCFEGFEGIACERSSCGTVSCSGHGQCFTSKELYQYYESLRDSSVPLQKTPVHVYPNAIAHFPYPTYAHPLDAYQFTHPTACHCEMGYAGPDCSFTVCPRGTDPLSLVNVDPATMNYPTYTLEIDTENFSSGVLRLGLLSEATLLVLPITDFTTLHNSLKSRFESFHVVEEFVVNSHSYAGAVYKIEFSLKFDFLSRYENNAFQLKDLPEPSDFICDTKSIVYTNNDPAPNNCVITRHAITEPYPHGDVCSGRGVCNITSGVCGCFNLYYGEACQKFLGNTDQFIEALPDDVLNLRIDDTLLNSYFNNVLKLESAYIPPQTLYWLRILDSSKEFLNIDYGGIMNLLVGHFHIKAQGFNKGVHIMDGSSSALGGVTLYDQNANVHSISISHGGNVNVAQGNAICDGIFVTGGGTVNSEGPISVPTGEGRIDAGGLYIGSGSLTVDNGGDPTASSSITGASRIFGDFTVHQSLSINGDVTIEGKLNLVSSITVTDITTAAPSHVEGSMTTKELDIYLGGLLINAVSGDPNIIADLDITGTVSTTADATFNSDLTVDLKLTTDDLHVMQDLDGGTISVGGNVVLNSATDSSSFGSAQVFGLINLDGDMTVDGDVTYRTIDITTDLTVTDTAQFIGDVKMTSDVHIGEDLVLSNVLPVFLSNVNIDGLRSSTLMSYGKITSTDASDNTFGGKFASKYPSGFLSDAYVDVNSQVQRLSINADLSVTGDVNVKVGSVSVPGDLDTDCVACTNRITGNLKARALEADSISATSTVVSKFFQSATADSVDTNKLSVGTLVYDVASTDPIPLELKSSSSAVIDGDLTSTIGASDVRIVRTLSVVGDSSATNLAAKNLAVNTFGVTGTTNMITNVKTGSLHVTGTEVSFHNGITVHKGGLVFTGPTATPHSVGSFSMTITQPELSRSTNMVVKGLVDPSTITNNLSSKTLNTDLMTMDYLKSSSLSTDALILDYAKVYSSSTFQGPTSVAVDSTARGGMEISCGAPDSLSTQCLIGMIDPTCSTFLSTNCLPNDLHTTCYSTLTTPCQGEFSVGCSTNFDLSCFAESLGLTATCLAEFNANTGCSVTTSAACKAADTGNCLASCCSSLTGETVVRADFESDNIRANKVTAQLTLLADDTTAVTTKVAGTCFVDGSVEINSGLVHHNTVASRITSPAFGAVTNILTENRITGNLVVKGTISAVAHNPPSDKRLKTNIEVIPSSLKIVNSLTGVNYQYNDLYLKAKNITNDDILSQTFSGVLAQEVQEVFPDGVEEVDNYLSVNYISLIPVLINSIQELSQKYDEKMSHFSSLSIPIVSQCQENSLEKLNKLEEMLKTLEQENQELEEMLSLITTSPF